jgi:hypothetical protein
VHSGLLNAGRVKRPYSIRKTERHTTQKFNLVFGAARSTHSVNLGHARVRRGGGLGILAGVGLLAGSRGGRFVGFGHDERWFDKSLG